MLKVVQVNFSKAICNKIGGYVTVYMREDGTTGARVRGHLSHLEIVGLLTMAIHSLEYNAMTVPLSGDE